MAVEISGIKEVKVTEADGVNVFGNMPGWLAHIGYIPQMIFMLDASQYHLWV